MLKPRFLLRLKKLLQGEVIGASLLLAALLIVFFWRPIFFGESWLPNDLIYELDPVWQSHAPAGFTGPGNRLLSDIAYLVYPWQVEIRRALAERQVPLWTTTINSGQPLLGNGQINVWDPFWMIARLFPLDTSFFVAAFLKLWVGGLSTFLLARQLDIGRRGAVLAMATFAFSGPMLVWLGSISGVAAWLPLLLYLSERALARQAIAPFLVIGLVIAFQFFSVHPETSFHIILVWAIFCLARTVARHGWNVHRLIRLLGRMTLAFVIGVALSAAVLLPTFEGILNSFILIRRQANTPVALLPTVLLEWRNWPTLVTMILPQFFGTPIDNSYWYPYQNYNEQTFYAGIVPLALGLVTLLNWWHDRRHGAIADTELNASKGAARGFWIGLTLTMVGIAAQLPFFNLANVLPLFRLANPGRLRFVYALGVALLAGYGLDGLVGNGMARFNAPKKLVTVLVVLAMVSLLLIGGAFAGATLLRDQFITMGRKQAEAMKASDHPMFPYSLDYYYERVNVRYSQTRRLYTLATPEMFLPVGVALAAGLLEWRRRKGNQTIWLNGLVLLTCADLFIIGIRLNPTMPPAQVFPATPAIRFLQEQPGLFRVGGLYLALMPNSSMVFGLSDVRGYEPVVPWRQATLFNRIEGAFRLNSYAILRSASSRLFDLMNVEYMITDRELGGRWRLAFAERDSPIRVYRNPDVLPRAFILYQWERAPTAEAALNRLVNDSFDFRTRVILEGAAPDLLSGSQMLPQVGQARIVHYEPERVVIETNTVADGILVLTDTYVPGWQAHVDAQPTEVYIADYAFRAVPIPAGQHRVELVYAPASFAVGSALSLAALACCTVWAAVILCQRVRCKSFIT